MHATASTPLLFLPTLIAAIPTVVRTIVRREEENVRVWCRGESLWRVEAYEQLLLGDEGGDRLVLPARAERNGG